MGTVLVLGGIFGALPVLGFWMLPLGLIILSVDFPWARRALAHLKLWWRKIKNRYRRHFGKRPAYPGGDDGQTIAGGEKKTNR